jgi:hypothetical protein
MGSGDTASMRIDTYTTILVHTVVAATEPEGLRAQSRHWFRHTYIRGTSDKAVTRLDDEEGRKRGNIRYGMEP